jgi:hypothetical protein
MENITRNASKHNKIEGDLELKLFVKDSAIATGYYEISIIDNQHEIHKANYFEKKKDLPQSINQIIQEPILYNDKVRESAWGILELKICATYLAKEKLELIDTVTINGEPIIKAAYFDENGTVKDDYKNFNFGYKFWLRKPKLAIIATNKLPAYSTLKDSEENPISIENQLNKKGIYLTDKTNLKDLLQNGTEHEYLVIIETKNENLTVPLLGNKSSNQKTVLISSEGEMAFRTFIQSTDNGLKEINEHLINLFYPSLSPQNITAEFEEKPYDENEAAAKSTRNKQSPVLVIKSSKGNIVFDQHGEAKKDNNLPDTMEYWENCGSQSGTAEILSNAKNSESLLNELVYSALCKVVIIDERIQENTDNHDKQNLKSANILIPSSEEVNLMKQSFEGSKLEEGINNYLALSPEYFIIHLGIIEKHLNATSKQEIMKWITKKFKLKNEKEERSIEQRTKLIIISGRGKPPTLPNRSLYLPYSLVAQCVLPANQSSKLKLIQLLNKARRV